MSPPHPKSDELYKLYVTIYKKENNKMPNVTKGRNIWNFSNIIEDLGIVKARKVVTNFAKSGATSPDKMFKDYDQLYKLYEQIEEDRKFREDLMQQTKERAEEWRKRNAAT